MDKWKVTDDYVRSVLSQRWGLTPQRTGRAHWNSPCFRCGGKDRLYITEIGRYTCNQCGISGWLDDDRQFTPDPDWQAKLEQQRALEKAEHERRWLDWTNGFLAGYYWRDWHDQMTEENRRWWRAQGINDHQIDYYELGYLPEKQIEAGSQKLVLPAYTIPIRDVKTWDINNVHYRLVNPPAGIQKYRYEHGIPSTEFYACPGEDNEKAIVVEGAKKAMVVYDRTDGACQVVGLPGATPSEDVLSRVQGFKQIWLALDPDCAKAESRFKRFVPQSRIVRLPDKPDDLFIAGMTKMEFRSYLAQAR